MVHMMSVSTSHKTVLKLSEEKLYDKFRTVLEPTLLTFLAVEPAPLVELVM